MITVVVPVRYRKQSSEESIAAADFMFHVNGEVEVAGPFNGFGISGKGIVVDIHRPVIRRYRNSYTVFNKGLI